MKRHSLRLAGRVPYGYDVDPRTKQFLVNPKEARHVQSMFDWAGEGMLPREIAASANAAGWCTKVTKAKKSGRLSGGDPWTPRQVLAVLSNPVYLGVFADAEGNRPGHHEAIVSQETFDMARAQIESRRIKKKPRGGKEIEWPLRGKTLCPRCRRIMSTHTIHGKDRIYRHYRCRSHAGGRPPCKGSSLPAYDIENTVAELLAKPALDRKHPLDQCFRMIWEALDSHTRFRLLPRVLKQVAFDPKSSNLTIELDKARIGQITDAVIEADLDNVKDAEPDSC